MRVPVLKFYVFLLLSFKVTLWSNIAILPKTWDQIFKTVFPKKNFLFSISSSKRSRNMRKVCVKLRNANIYPPCGHIFNIHFFK